VGAAVSAADLLALAERCEQATGPDRELDAAIARAIGLELQVVSIGPDYRRERLSWIDRESGAAPVARPVPNYTSSFEEAMRSIPAGWYVRDLSHWPAKKSVLDDSTSDEEWTVALVAAAREGVQADAFARLAHLALCAAALRARDASCDRNPTGQDREAGLGAEHESAVGEAETPKDNQ
jgi:hypothetical protein